MTRSLFATLIVVSVVIGALLGVAYPINHASATTSAQIKITPGGSWGWLTTTWHDSPTALDWAKQGGGASGAIFWRSWTFRSDTSFPIALGTIVPSASNTSVCYRTRVEYKDTTGASVASAYYTHTPYNGNGTTTIYGDINQEYLIWSIATYAYPDMSDDCPSSGPHVHQYVGSWYIARTSAFATVLQNYGLSGSNDYQHSKYWTW